jgi:hypothetical protein
MPLALLTEGFRFAIEMATIPRIRAVNPEINERKTRIAPNCIIPKLKVLTEEIIITTPINKAATVPIPVNNDAEASPSPPLAVGYGIW